MDALRVRSFNTWRTIITHELKDARYGLKPEALKTAAWNCAFMIVTSNDL